MTLCTSNPEECLIEDPSSNSTEFLEQIQNATSEMDGYISDALSLID
jgi:hypothetical protein